MNFTLSAESILTVIVNGGALWFLLKRALKKFDDTVVKVDSMVSKVAAMESFFLEHKQHLEDIPVLKRDLKSNWEKYDGQNKELFELRQKVHALSNQFAATKAKVDMHLEEAGA